MMQRTIESRERARRTNSWPVGYLPTCWLLFAWLLGGSDLRAQTHDDLACDENRYLSCSELVQCEPRLTRLFTKLHLARCQEATGECVAARSTYQRLAERAKELEAQPEELVAESALERIDAQCPGQVEVELTLTKPIDGAVVLVDDAALQADRTGNPVKLKLDVNTRHTIRVTAAGFESWETTVLVGNRNARIEVPSLVPLPPVDRPSVDEGPSPPLAPVDPHPEGPNSWLTVSTLGTGVATIASTFWYFDAQHTANKAYRDYTNDPTEAGWQGVEERRGARDAAGTVLAISAIAFGVSAILLGSEWAVRTAGDDSQEPAMAIEMDPDGAVAVVRGAF